MRPVIGIAPRYLPGDDANPLEYLAARTAVVSSVLRAGGQPVLLCFDGSTPQGAREALDCVAAVVFPGGGDSDPALYGQPDRHPKLRLVAPEQDASDLVLARTAIEVGLPTLGICRGMQLLNIVQGGTLVQYMDPSTVEHWDSSHEIRVTQPESRLAAMFGTDTLIGRSFHQQCVSVIGTDLVATAVAADGCVEAIEHETAPIVGLQWHPELASEFAPPLDEPFGWLVGLARASRSDRVG
ncbi:MAG: gamma-glutamyl-gamma-aminobutyrate hydrolase family protein [Nocardioidaceae bacterium]